MIEEKTMTFNEALTDLVAATYEASKAKGFYDGPQNDGEKIALMHSELSEALEALRHGNPASEHIPEYSALEEEMADEVIRVMDFCGYKKLRLAEAICAKMVFNASRPPKHGKAF